MAENRAEKIAVVLFNLGGPDCKNAIKPFLMNFFMDRNIIDLPVPFRCILASLISSKRSRREAGDSYGELGDKSPLLENSQKQAAALDKILKKNSNGAEYKSFVCMRYWHPMSAQIVREVRDWGADKIVILPLYPQFSTATTWSSLGQWKKAIHQAGMEDIPTSTICCYPQNSGFIKASAMNIRKEIQQAKKDGHSDYRVLFSAHGLPEKTIKGGDPYQAQCQKTMQAIVKELGIENLDSVECYQSRVGPLKWIGPSTEDEIARAVQDKKAIILFPHAFTQEHVETIVELGIEYRHAAEAMGVQGYYVAETVGTHPDFIEGLAALVQTHENKQGVFAEGGACICGSESSKCCMRQDVRF
jgi:ferrochelatase